MLGINPFDQSPFGYGGLDRRPPPMKRPPQPPVAEPHITTNSTADEYTITVSAPAGHKLDNPQATLVNAREMEVIGILQPTTTVCEWLTLGRTAVYARPSGRQLLGVVPPHTVLSGEPWNYGWVALDNDEGWVYSDDLRMLSRPSPPRRFERSVGVPADALSPHATSRMLDSGSLHITVPRRQPAARPESARAAPKRSVATGSPPQPPTARPTVASTAPKPAAPKSAVPKPAASPAERAASPSGAGHAQRLPASADGPVLMEVEASDNNVQLPHETTQDWHASACGGFVKSQAAGMEAVSGVAAAAVSPSGGDDDKKLEFYGF